MHEERGQFVDEQHGGMAGHGEQQEENHRGGAGHAQGRASAEKISEPAGTTQKRRSEHVSIYVGWRKTETGASPSKHGPPEQLDHAHRGLQVAEPQGVEAQFLCQILETRRKRRFQIPQMRARMLQLQQGRDPQPCSRKVEAVEGELRPSEVIFHLHLSPYLISSHRCSHKGTCLVFTLKVGV